MKKGALADLSPLVQLFTLVLLILFCFVASSFLLLLLISFCGEEGGDLLSQSVLVIQLTQLFSAIGIFLLPSLIMAWLCSPTPCTFLSLDRRPTVGAVALLFPATLSLLPFVTLLGFLNAQLQLPSFMAPLEEWMRAQELLSGQMIKQLLAEQSLSTFLMNVLVISLCAGITEELLFRGTLYSILGRSIRRHHLLIWLIAIIFSAVHLQFFSFLPRLLLGAYLGYLLYWSKSCWLPIIAHCFNNLFVLLCLSHSGLKEAPLLNVEKLTTDDLVFLLLSSAVGLMFFLLCVRALKRNCPQEGGDALL